MYKYFQTILLVSFILINIECIAQNRFSAQIPISVTLIKPVVINKVNGDLDFNNIKTTSLNIKTTKSPEDGVIFELTNMTKRKVVIEINDVPLYNLNRKSKSQIIFFEPQIKNSSFSTHVSNDQMLNKKLKYTPNPAPIKNQQISIGGRLVVPQNIPDGIYSGDFILTLVY